MRTYKMRFLSWILGAVVLVVSVTMVKAQTPSAIVTLPIPGQFVFPTLGNTNLYLIDPSVGTSYLLAADDPDLEAPKISPSGNQIAYHSGISSGEHNIIFDVVRGNSQIVNPLVGRNSEPIGWSADGSNILYKTYSIDANYYDIHGFEVYDLNNQTLTPVGAFHGWQTLVGLPRPQGVGDFIFYPNTLWQIIRNPVHDTWIAMTVEGIDSQILPDPKSYEGDIWPQGAHLYDVVLWNYETGQLLSGDVVLEDTIDISEPIAWSADGNYLVVPTFGSVNLLHLKVQNDNWSLETIDNADSGSQLVSYWLGVEDLLIASDLDSTTNDTVFYIAQILNGEWHSTEFLRFPEASFGGVGMGDWRLTATAAERQTLSCLFDQSLTARLEIGKPGRVAFTDGAASRLRVAPGTDNQEISLMREGTGFDVTDGPYCADGYRWWQLELADQTSGWAAEADNTDYFLEPVSSK